MTQHLSGRPLLAAFLILLGVAGAAAQPVTVTLTPQTIPVGAVVDVPVMVGTTGGRDVFGYSFTLTADPSVALLEGVETNGTQSAGWAVATNSPEAGQLRVAAAGTASLAGDGVLVTVRVRGVSGGTTAASWLAFTFNEGNPEASATGTVLTVGNPTGMEDAPEAVELRAWPNPSRGRVTVDVPCGGASVGVDVVDVLGRVVARVPSVCGTVALPALMAGRYIVRAGRWTAPVTVAK